MSYDHNKYTANYAKENYDRISINIPKGKKEVLKQVAQDNNITDHKGQISVARMIINAVEEKYGIDLSRPN